MGAKKLYKYLDATGGLMMLYHKNLQFTNATQLNDPFDCHPAFINVTPDPTSCHSGIPVDLHSNMIYQNGLNNRNKTYICSLSKVHNSILMWSYYNGHNGICIGLDMEKTRPYLKQMYGMAIGCLELEVQYQNRVPCSFSIPETIATKAKEWQHEKEVRLVSYDPSSDYMQLLPNQKDKEEPIDWKEVRAFLGIGGECFDTVFLGVKMKTKEEEKIVKVARCCNPNIKIYKMGIDPMAFCLTEEPITQ